MEFHDHVLDYLKWRGDLTFSDDGFNEIDALICAEISYINMEGIVPPVGYPSTVTVEQVYDAYQDKLARKEAVDMDVHEMRFLLALGKTRRYKDLLLSDYARRIMDTRNGEKAMQFGAVCIHIHRFLHYISFQGTDEEIVGWKENLNMLYQFPIPSQTESLMYLNKVARGPFNRYLVGGHSKGGNLAKYASAFCKESLQKKIRTIYCFDAPGFPKNMMEYEGYARINERIQAYIPQDSMVGILLEHAEGNTIIHSQGEGIGQHDLESWSATRDGFVYEKERTAKSYRMEATIGKWLHSFTEAELHEFSCVFCELITRAGIETFPELMELHLKTVLSILKEMKHASAKEKELVFRVVKALIVESNPGRRKREK